jgi:hypothetical protein
MAIQHWKFEEEKENEESYAVIMSPQAVKYARTGMGSMLSLYREAAGDGQSDAAEGRKKPFSSEKERDAGCCNPSHQALQKDSLC